MWAQPGTVLPSAEARVGDITAQDTRPNPGATLEASGVTDAVGHARRGQRPRSLRAELLGRHHA